MEVLENMVVLVAQKECIVETQKGPVRVLGGEIMEVSEEDFKREIDKGKNPGTNRWMSALLNHFDLSEASAEIKALVRKVDPPPVPKPVVTIPAVRRGRKPNKKEM